jgi:hypothetical protein
MMMRGLWCSVLLTTYHSIAAAGEPQSLLEAGLHSNNSNNTKLLSAQDINQIDNAYMCPASRQCLELERTEKYSRPRSSSSSRHDERRRDRD